MQIGFCHPHNQYKFVTIDNGILEINIKYRFDTIILSKKEDIYQPRLKIINIYWYISKNVSINDRERCTVKLILEGVTLLNENTR